MYILNPIKASWKNKYFRSLTLLSFFIFIVLTSLALLASFIIYKDEVNRKALSVHTERLNLYVTQFNNQYAKMLSLVDQLVIDKNVLGWVNSEPGDQDMYQSKLILDELKKMSVLNESIFSLEVFAPKSKLVLSQYYGLNSENTDSAFMQKRKSIYADFLGNNNIKQVMISSGEINNAETPTVFLLNSVPAYKKSGVIGLEVIASKLMPQNISPGENIFIVDSSNPSVFFSNTSAHFSIHKEDIPIWIRKILSQSPGGHLQAIKIEGQTYYAAYRDLFNKKFKLLMLVPESDMASNLAAFTVYFKIAFMIIVMLSILCSFFIYRVANKPIKRIAESVSRKMNGISSYRNDDYMNDNLNYLNHTFEMILTKNSEIEKVLHEHEEVFKENTLRSLIYGKTDEELFYKNRLLDSSSGVFLILVFNTDSHHQKMAAHVFENADSLIFRPIINHYEGVYIRTGFRQYTMLIKLQKTKEREPLLTTVKQLQESIQKEYGSTLTVGVSSVREHLADIHLCYNEAQEAVRFKTLLGNNRIIDSLQLKNAAHQTNSFSVQEGQTLIKKLRTAGEEEICDTIIKMIDDKKNQYSIELLNAFLLYISSCIAQVGMEYNISPDVIFDNNLFKIIVESESIDDMKSSLIQQCKKIIEIRNMEQKKYKKLSGELAIKYIEENYNKPISLDIVSAALHMSPSYLSRLIKQELGNNFTAYLNKLRVDKAIELLLKVNLTVKDISMAVGYENEHTFIRNFKSVTGKTPADYRNSVIRPGARESGN